MAEEQIKTTTTTTETTSDDSPSLLSNILAIIGFILVIVIVIWGLVHLADLTKPLFASLFNNKHTTTAAQTSGMKPLPPIASTTVNIPSKPVASAKPAPKYNSTPADLSVSIISATSDGYGNATVVFEIANIGGSSSGSYSFSAQLPTMQSQAYNSVVQSPLGPGDRIVNTLRFSQATPGTFSVVVNAADVNATNNFASVQLNAPYSNYNNGYNYYPQPQPYQYIY